MDVCSVRIGIGGYRNFSNRQSSVALRCLAFIVLAQAAVGADYIGASQCKACHLKNFERQSHSAHALALFKAAQHPRIGELPISESWLRAPGISAALSVTPQGLLARLADSSQSQQVILDWAFGAGSQGITFVGKIPGQAYLEFSLSYYTQEHVFGVTPGHESIHPVTAAQGIGRPFETYGSSGEIMECFQCHSTGPIGVSPDDSIEPLESGVRCEACHGPGSAHRDAVAHGLTQKAVPLIQSPGRLSAPELNKFCGGCHRFQVSGRAQLDLNFSWNVRHQPPYLEQSACFRNSNGRLSCLTCHDPHESAIRDDAEAYNRKCLTCHQSDASRVKVCKAVVKGNCIDCHMPLVRPSQFMQFRSHWIGVYTPQEATGSSRFVKPRS